MTQFVREQLKQGRQAYYLSVSQRIRSRRVRAHLTSAVTAAEKLANEVFPDFTVGLLHGRIKSQRKGRGHGAFSKKSDTHLGFDDRRRSRSRCTKCTKQSWSSIMLNDLDFRSCTNFEGALDGATMPRFVF